MARQCRRQEKTEGRPNDKGQRTITWARVILSPTRLCNIMGLLRGCSHDPFTCGYARVSKTDDATRNPETQLRILQAGLYAFQAA